MATVSNNDKTLLICTPSLVLIWYVKYAEAAFPGGYDAPYEIQPNVLSIHGYIVPYFAPYGKHFFGDFWG